METIRRGVALLARAQGRHRRHPGAGRARLARPGRRPDRGAADPRPRHPRRPGGPDVSFTVWVGLLAAVAIVVTSWASYAMTSTAVLDLRAGPGHAADQGVPARPRPAAAHPEHRAPRRPGLPGDQRRRPGQPVPGLRRPAVRGQHRSDHGRDGGDGRSTAGSSRSSCGSCFAPLFLSLRYFQRKLSAAYGMVRRQVGIMLSAISEPVVGAAVVRSYAVEARTQERIDTAIRAHQSASTRAQGFTAFSFSLGGISAGLANAGVIIVGVWLGFAGEITAGEVLAFAFLVTLVRRPGADGHPDPHRRAERDRRLAPGDRHPRDPGRPGRPRAGGRDPAAGPDRRALRRRRVRLPRWAAGAPRRRPRDRRRAPGGDRRGDRVGQVDVRQAAHPADGPGAWCGAARRHRRTPHRTCLAAPQRGAGPAGGLPVRRHDRRQRPLRPARRHRGRDPGERRRARPARLARRAPARPGHPGRASAASRCPRASGSWSRCSAPTSPIPTCWCSTRPPAPSTPRWRCGSAGRSSG